MMLCSNCSQEIKPVVAVDIDGTLGDYHSHFIRFAEQYLGRPLPRNYTGAQEFSEFLQMPKDVYRNIKLAYRQGGMKRSMPMFNHASWFMHALKKYGLEVWITTTRPYLRLDNIDPDTRTWLERHDIPYDAMIFGDDRFTEDNKFDMLLRMVDGNRVVAVVEDLTELCQAASDMGLTVLQHHTRYNSDPTWPDGDQMFIILYDRIERLTDEWREKHDDLIARNRS